VIELLLSVLIQRYEHLHGKIQNGFTKIQNGLTILVLVHLGNLGEMAIKQILLLYMVSTKKEPGKPLSI